MADAFILYAAVVADALPIALAFSVGNLIVTTILKAALGGKLEF